MSHSTNPGNPAVIGLTGFGMTTLVLQLHNLGLCGLGPVFALGLVFGGAAQFWAGLQELKIGNNFGACAFVGYGSFWISLILILLSGRFNLFPVQPHDLLWFLVAYTIFTAILWVAALKISKNLAVVFTLLLLGFIFLDLDHMGLEIFKKIAAIDLILCAGSAIYGAAKIFYGDIFCKGECAKH
ncbi:acetate uptake transporter [Holophaga foetida]|uniref:acetate uptake transporter n=1 Tax=Holophaga foetida TaxID=35839 RepID=UPI0002472F3C|nr:GPR1/FUN34/YaaH family transporter [Holophaga foetida]